MSLTRLLIGLASSAAITSVIAVAAQPPAPSQPQFRSSVQIVHLDVSVLDAQRRPVRGLTPADFTILEDGHPRPVSVFHAVDIPDVVPASAEWVHEVAHDVVSNENLEQRRLFLILVDDMTIQSDLRALKNARDIATGIVDRFGPSDLAAVVFTRDNRNAQDFTADRSRLRAALDNVSVGFRDMGLFDPEARQMLAGQDDYYFMSSVTVLEEAVRVLSSMPDRRKAIIYVGQGIPVDLSSVEFAQPGLPAGGAVSSLMSTGQQSRIRMQIGRIARDAQRANVNVYTVDICGLRAAGSAYGMPPPTCVPGLEADYLRVIAANTGGRAVVETNDFTPGIEAIFTENGSYYLLGFQPPDTNLDGRFRRLEVKVNRPGVTVRARTGYQSEKPDARKRQAAQAQASPLGTALSGILPRPDLPMQVSTVAVPIPGRKESAVAMTMAVRQPIRPSEQRTVERVTMQVSAFSVSGRHVASQRFNADVAIRAGANGLVEYEVLSKMELKPGRYQLRLAAHIGSLSTSGSVYADVDVVDVTKAPISMLALQLSATPGPIVAPRDALKGVLTLVPTTRRTFVAGDRVTAFTRVFQGGKEAVKPLAIRVQLRSPRDETIVDRPIQLPADRFTGDRSAEVAMDLPVDQLAPGEYLLRIEAESGSGVRRDLRFRVGAR